MRGLDGKIALVVGAAPGNIAGATAHRLAEEGAVVLAADIRGDAAQAVADEINAAGGHADAGQVDLSDEASVRTLIERTVGQFGGIHTLFNAAADLFPETAGVDRINNVMTIPLDVWRRVFEVDLTGYLLTTRYALPHMMAAGEGSIVNTMSAAAWLGEPIRLAYGSAKLAIAALTRHTATIAGKQGVRCNAVAPGATVTDNTLRTQSEDVLKQRLDAALLARLGRPADIAAAVAFLCSDDGSWITGQVISVDGGLTMRG